MRFIAVSVFLIGLVLSSTAAGPAFTWDDLANGRIDWGQPPWPADEIAYPTQVLPQAAGWFHYLSRGEEYSSPLAAGGGYVLVQDGHELLALKLADGAEAWRIPCDPYIQHNPFAAGAGMFFFSTSNAYGKGELVALRAEDGTTAWPRPGLQLFGTAPGGVWAALRYEAKRTVYASLRLLAADSGAELKSFDLPPDYVPPGGVWRAKTDKWPILSRNYVRMAYADGSTVDLPRLHPDWQAYLGLAQDALVLCENPPYVFSFDRDQPGAPAPEIPVTSCFALPGGKLLWRREDLPSSSPQYGMPFFVIGSGCVVFTAYDELDVLDLRDGRPRYRWTAVDKPEVDLGSAHALAAAPGVIYFRGSKDRESVWYRLNLAVESAPVEQAEFSETIAPWASVDGMLICNAGHFQWGGGPHTSALLALRLGPDGAPLAGQLDLSMPQPDYAPLIARFLASPAPLEDEALMRDITAQGINAVLALLPATPPERAEHLDALLAETIHLYHMDVLRRGTREELDYFFTSLKRIASPAYAPTMVRWLNEPTLNWLPDDARIALAYCGGPEAREYLCAWYDAREVKLHAQSAAPYALLKPQDEASEFRQTQLLVQAGRWAQVELSGGQSYVVFPASGLQNERDLYSAYDAQGDGQWDWILPTGLQDVFYQYQRNGMYYYYQYPAPRGTLALGFTGDALRISHNRPLPGQPNPVPEGAEFVVDFVEDKVPLAEILRDSDGDGLTDITERALLTDPAVADSDGDGMGDAHDATPNANAARMGAVERGIARAMRYFYSDYYAGQGWWDPPDRAGFYAMGQPWNARYFTVSGCDPVAFSNSPGTYGICINTPEQLRQYTAGASGLEEPSLVALSWVTREMAQQDPGGASYHLTAEYLDDYPAADMLVAFDRGMSGDSVQLKLVDGEYIPIGSAYNWVVD